MNNLTTFSHRFKEILLSTVEVKEGNLGQIDEGNWQQNGWNISLKLPTYIDR